MDRENTLKAIGEKVLEEIPETRDDLNIFVIEVLKRLGINVSVNYYLLKQKHVSFDSIIVMRRNILHKEGKFNKDFIPEDGVTYFKPGEEYEN